MIRRQLFTLTLYSFKVNVIYYFHTIINDMPSLIIPSVQNLGSKSITLIIIIIIVIIYLIIFLITKLYSYSVDLKNIKNRYKNLFKD